MPLQLQVAKASKRKKRKPEMFLRSSTIAVIRSIILPLTIASYKTSYGLNDFYVSDCSLEVSTVGTLHPVFNKILGKSGG